MGARKDSLGVEVEVGDIVFSAPRHKWSGDPEIGQVTGVFSSGRVTIKVPRKVTIYAYERGAPDIEKTSYRWVEDQSQPADRWGRRPMIKEPYTHMTSDFTHVGHEWKWLKKQAADITLIVLRKNGKELGSIESILSVEKLNAGLTLDYDADSPQLG